MSNIDIIESNIQDINTEALIVGSLFSKPDIFLDYAELIIPKYDFYHEPMKFLYNSIFELFHYKTNENITEVKINIYMNQDENRKKQYKELGGYQYIQRLMNIADPYDFENYYNDFKKYSLLRELERKGFPAQKILQHKHFAKLTPEDVVNAMEYSINTISTQIGGVEDSIVLGKDLPNVLNQWKETPDFGIDIPFPLINQLIRGWRKKKLNLLGLHSGFGKSRITSKIVAYIGIYLKIPIVVLVNEQDKTEWDAMITSVVANNLEFGFNLNIDETDIVTGNYDEAMDKRLQDVAKWIAENSQIRFIMLNKYDAVSLKRQLKRHKIMKCDFYVYDTMKAPDHDWQSFVKTGDMLKNICNELDMGGLGTFQLTDDSLFDEMLTSKAIASGKHIKHIADGLMMAKPLPKDKYDKHEIYNPNSPFEYMDLDPKSDYYYVQIDKNRGGKDKLQILLSVDKGKNYWQEEGYLRLSNDEIEHIKLKKEAKRLKVQQEVENLKKKIGKQ